MSIEKRTERRSSRIKQQPRQSYDERELLNPVIYHDDDASTLSEYKPLIRSKGRSSVDGDASINHRLSRSSQVASVEDFNPIFIPEPHSQSPPSNKVRRLIMVYRDVHGPNSVPGTSAKRSNLPEYLRQYRGTPSRHMLSPPQQIEPSLRADGRSLLLHSPLHSATTRGEKYNMDDLLQEYEIYDGDDNDHLPLQPRAWDARVYEGTGPLVWH